MVTDSQRAADPELGAVEGGCFWLRSRAHPVGPQPVQTEVPVQYLQGHGQRPVFTRSYDQKSASSVICELFSCCGVQILWPGGLPSRPS